MLCSVLRVWTLDGAHGRSDSVSLYRWVLLDLAFRGGRMGHHTRS